MPSVLQRPSLVGRAVALGPVLVVGYYAQACFAAFGPRPEVEIDPGSTVTPEMTRFLAPDTKRLFALIQEAHKVPKRTNITERERAVAQTMTWGMAGAAVVILTAIATSSKTFNGPAILVAAGCFASTCLVGWSLLAVSISAMSALSPSESFPVSTVQP